MTTFVTAIPVSPVREIMSSEKVGADTTFLTITALFCTFPQKTRMCTIKGTVSFACAVTCSSCTKCGRISTIDLLTIFVLLRMETGMPETSNVTMSSTVMNSIGGGGCCGWSVGGAGGAGGARGRGFVGDVEDADWNADTAITASKMLAAIAAAHSQRFIRTRVAVDSCPLWELSFFLSDFGGRTPMSGLILVSGMVRYGAAGGLGGLTPVPANTVCPLKDDGMKGTEPSVPPNDTPLPLVLPDKLARSSNRSENFPPPAFLLGRRRRVVCG